MKLNESFLKCCILTHGVVFTEKALKLAKMQNAKMQNMVYNLPQDATFDRPQELFLKNEFDGYTTVVSCVASVNRQDAVVVDADLKKKKLFCTYHNIDFPNVELSFVETPSYYNKTISSGEMVKMYITSCGYDELNILPWTDCSISSGCKFCGVNTVGNLKEQGSLFSAFTVGDKWDTYKGTYLSNLDEALKIAVGAECFIEHMHVILISGNLPYGQLNKQTEIYSEIANNIWPYVKEKSTEGIVAVMMPPNDLDRLSILKQNHIERVVFNLEVATEPWFTKYCPGKAALGYNHIVEALKNSIQIFGKGNVWTNFVFGLEPIQGLLDVCENFGKLGIVPGANVLHMDTGNRLDCSSPGFEKTIDFYRKLACIYKKFGLKPYYCEKALRTSLINESVDERLV